MADDPALARRRAVATICERAATGVIDRVVQEATGAATFFGLGADKARAYGEGIHSTIPVALDGIVMPDGPDRDARIRDLAGRVRAVSDQHHVPRIVERGLTAIAMRLAREVIRRKASEHGFTADELDREFRIFEDKLEARLFGDEA